MMETPEALVELVPNVSEGRDTGVVRAIADAFSQPEGVWLLDVHSDRTHNRSVLTAVARPSAAVAAVGSLVSRAVSLIDMRKHRGIHPRIGAVDVVPLVGLGGIPRPRLDELARAVGEHVSDALDVPICFYGSLAAREAHVTLASLRRGGFEKLLERFRGGELVPDFGPSRPHPSAGMTAVTVRGFLIAFNVTLRTTALSVATAIAREVRASSGGLPHLQALGFRLGGGEDRLVQVSMNLTDFRTTTLLDAYQAVETAAERRGVEVEGSEIVGLIPEAASFEGIAKRLKLASPPGILEARLAEARGITSS